MGVKPAAHGRSSRGRAAPGWGPVWNSSSPMRLTGCGSPTMRASSSEPHSRWFSGTATAWRLPGRAVSTSGTAIRTTAWPGCCRCWGDPHRRAHPTGGSRSRPMCKFGEPMRSAARCAHQQAMYRAQGVSEVCRSCGGQTSGRNEAGDGGRSTVCPLPPAPRLHALTLSSPSTVAPAPMVTNR